MAKPTTNTNRPTAPTTPAQPNIAIPTNLPRGAMPVVPNGTPFARTIVPDAKASTCDASYLVSLSEKHPWAYSVRTTFVFPKSTSDIAMVWAVRALRVDMQSRIRRAHTSKDEATRNAAPLAATWAKIDVTMPEDAKPADPATVAKREASALATTIASLRRAGKNREADMLAAL